MSAATSNKSVGLARLDGITAARGLTALAIVLHHGCGHLLAGSIPALWQQAGLWAIPAIATRAALWVPDTFNHQAVLLFVFLSGFCTHVSLAQRWAAGDMAPLQPWRYLRKRAMRLIPVVFVALLLTAGCDWISAFLVSSAPGPLPVPGTPQIRAVLNHDYLSLPQFFGSVFFAMPFWIKPYGSNWPLWVLGWLAWFYLLYPLYASVSRRAGGYAALGLSFAVMAASVVVQRHADLALYPVFRSWWLWCLGAYCAEVFVGRHALPIWARASAWLLLPGLAVTVLLAHLVRGLPALVSYLVWAPLLFFATLKLAQSQLHGPSWVRRPLLALGATSFSLYVCHMPAMVLLAVGWCRAFGGLPSQPWLVLGGALLLTGVGALFYALVESPVEGLRLRTSRSAG